MSKIQMIYNVIEGAHCMDADGLTIYPAALAVRDAQRCRDINQRLAKAKHALNAFRVTVSAALRESDMQYTVSLHNRVTGLEILL